MDIFIENGLEDVVLRGAHINLSASQKEIGSRVDVFIELDNETSGESTILEFFLRTGMGFYTMSQTSFMKMGLI